MNTTEVNTYETLNETVCNDGLVIEMIGAASDPKQPASPDNAIIDLLTATRSMPLAGLTWGLANITKMVAEPQSMEGTVMSPSVILISSDGQGVTLCAPYNMNVDIPFAPLAAMVERMFTPSMATVVIQEHASGGNKQPPKRQILGQINPFYSMVTIYQGYAGQYLTAEKAPEVIQHFYVDRGDLMHFYITAKLHLQAVRRREDMESYILGWKGFDIPYAIDVQQNELLKSRLETDFSAENSGLNRTTPNCN